jgi:protein phosphatase 1H
VRIKPFLSSQPQVRIIDLKATIFGEDDVIVMGTDGLWDVTANDTVASIVFNTVDQYPSTVPQRFKYRYISAAQDLVMHARGKFNDRNWKMSDGSPATIDDISVFVIPLWSYKMELEEAAKVPPRIEDSENETPSEFSDVLNENESIESAEPATGELTASIESLALELDSTLNDDITGVTND